MAFQSSQNDKDIVLTEVENPKFDHGRTLDVPANPYEKSALRKFDLILLPQIALLILVAFLDRTNIGNAKVFGFEGQYKPILLSIYWHAEPPALIT